MEEAEIVVKPSHSLRPADRLAIYRGMYAARLVSALKIDYPVLFHFLGEDTFQELAQLYIHSHPSQSYTLNRLGDHLPEFLKTVEGIPAPSFAADVARLELLETQVFDEEETIAEELPELAAMKEAEWERVQFAPIAACRLGEFRYPVHRYFALLRAGKAVRRPRPANTHLLVYRRNYQLHHAFISAATKPVLDLLLAGEPLGAALFAGRHLHPRTIQRCFSEWFASGLFARAVLAR
ncbi:DNA-binding domain-containing protein [Oscillatoria amoena NRMC-F 0135]|nr:DNA-binding domain-containing protein [Oscillatoria amoena NRMC-F 0135]